MSQKFQDQNSMTFIVSIPIELSKLLKYRYSITVDKKNVNEEKFRYFLNNNFQEENLIDEWNQVWYVYVLKWSKQEFFDEFEFQNNSQYLQNQDIIIYQLRELNPTDEKQITQQYLTYVFENYETFNPQQRDQILLYKNQKHYLNYIKIDYSFGQLGKSLGKHIGTQIKDQIDQICKTQKDQIEKQNKEFQTKKCEWDKQYFGFQIYASNKIQESKNEVLDLQKLLGETNQQLIHQKYEQMNIQKVDFKIEFDKQQQSQTSIELEKALQNYQDNVELLQRKKQDLQRANLSNKNLKAQNQLLHSLVQECESKLNTADEKLADYEKEIQQNKDRNEQNKKTIVFLKKQIDLQKIEIENYKIVLNEMQTKLEESEKQKIDLQKKLELKAKNFTDATTKQILASEEISQLKNYIQEQDFNRQQQMILIQQLEQEALKLKNDFEEMEKTHTHSYQQLNEKDQAITEFKKKIQKSSIVISEKKVNIDTFQNQCSKIKLQQSQINLQYQQELRQREEEIEQLKNTLIILQEQLQKNELEKKQWVQQQYLYLQEYQRNLVAQLEQQEKSSLDELYEEINKIKLMRKQDAKNFNIQTEDIEKEYDKQIKKLQDQRKKDVSKLNGQITILKQEHESEIEYMKQQNKKTLEEEKQKFNNEKVKLLQDYQQKLNEIQQTEDEAVIILKASNEEMIRITNFLQQTIIEKDEEIDNIMKLRRDEQNRFEQQRKQDQAKYNTLRMQDNKNKELEIQQIQQKCQNQIDELEAQSLDDKKNIDLKYQRQIQELNQEITNLELLRSQERENFLRQRQLDISKFQALQQQMLNELQSDR